MDKGKPWLPFSKDLWVVNHFSRDRRAAAKDRSLWTSLSFDFVAAEREIRARQSFLEEAFLKERAEAHYYDEPARSELVRALAEMGTDEENPMSGLDARREPPSPMPPAKNTERYFSREHAMVDRGSRASARERLNPTRARRASQRFGFGVAH